ncbi:MAG: hypothetical protein VX768_12760 [Planctomycetota bacterium]|nr:hypothetical protein [Planctomycetota bacterium]
MGQNSQPISSSVFSINVSAEGEEVVSKENQQDSAVVELLQQLIIGQEKQNELLEEMIEGMNASQRQRSAELGQWKQSNPHLAKRCRQAAEVLSDVQTEFLESLTGEIEFNADSLLEGDFMLNEFVDKFGPRLAHLNGVLQVLSQLSSTPKSYTEED